MKKLLSVLVLSAVVVLANGASAEWNLVDSAQKVQDKADAAAKKIEDAKAKDAEKQAELKAKLEAKKAEAAQKKAEKDAEAAAKKAEKEKAVNDAKNSLSNLKNSFAN